MRSGYRGYVLVTKLRCSFWGARRLVEKLNDDVPNENYRASRDVLRATHFNNTDLSRADERDALVYIEDAAAYTRGRKQYKAFNGRVFYSYAVLLRQKLRSMHETACEKHPLNFLDAELTEILQTKIFSLSVKNL